MATPKVLGAAETWQQPTVFLSHFCCISAAFLLCVHAHTASNFGACRLCSLLQGNCKRGWQRVCAESRPATQRCHCHSLLKGQRFESGSGKFSHSWLLVQLLRDYETFGGEDWGLENRTRFKRPVFSSSLWRVSLPSLSPPPNL